jgi:hypothetical protein
MDVISPELQRVEVLQAFKRRMPQSGVAENVSPFDDRVTTAHGNIAGSDLPEIHSEVRQRIKQIIEVVRNGEKKSQVVLLAGDAGTGKTHLLRTFQAPALTEELDYVYVGGSNHWTINEFQARLLDWIIEALTAPSPAQDHLLLDRIRAIGFRAVDHLLANPVAWRHCRARHKGGWLGRLPAWLGTPSHDRQKQMAAARDPAVFRSLDFTRFSEYVCDRFLADKSNATHRYALRVLLTYLFPSREETGIGTRERVLHWFRGRANNDYFTRRLGANERLDRQYSLFDAVKLLVHLFSPAVSKELSTADFPCPSRVFLLVFDQAEGRNELFESDKDWMDFFAHLAELYNTLPNVMVLFTMTLHLRTRLQSMMERQFRDRIRMDERFVLRLPDEDQILALYRSRIEYWLRDDPARAALYRGLKNQYLPFDRRRVLETAGQQSLRDTLAAFDEAFHQAMSELVLEPEFDFQFYLNELHPRQTSKGNFEYTADHLKTAREFLQKAGPWLAEERGMRLDGVEEVADASPATLALWFADPANSHVWVCAYLAKLTFSKVQYQVDEATKLLAHKQKARYTVWMVRAGEIKADLDPNKIDRLFPRVTPSALESRLRALLHVIGKQKDYEAAGGWETARELIRREFADMYLGELFGEVRKRLGFLLAGTMSDQPDESEEAAPAGP